MREQPDAYAALAARLPSGTYRLADAKMPTKQANMAAFGWGLASYRFTRYRASKAKPPVLVWPETAHRLGVEAMLDGNFLARDLINTPASDMGPQDLAAAAKTLAKTLRRQDQRHRGRRSAEEELSHGACRGPRVARASRA